MRSIPNSRHTHKLQAVLVGLVDLQLFATHLRWAATGPDADRFRAVALDVAEDSQALAERVAAEIVRRGATPNAQSRTVAIQTRIEPLPTRRIRAPEGARELEDRIGAVIGQIASATSGETEIDPQSSALLAEVTEHLTHQRRRLS